MAPVQLAISTVCWRYIHGSFADRARLLSRIQSAGQPPCIQQCAAQKQGLSCQTGHLAIYRYTAHINVWPPVPVCAFASFVPPSSAPSRRSPRRTRHARTQRSRRAKKARSPFALAALTTRSHT